MSHQADTKANPLPNSCYARALPDEPLFTLLGRDPAAPYVILFWCKMRELMYGAADEATIMGAADHIEEFRNWATKLGKSDKLVMALAAFKRACFEVAKAELEASQANEPNPGAGI